MDAPRLPSYVARRMNLLLLLSALLSALTGVGGAARAVAPAAAVAGVGAQRPAGTRLTMIQAMRPCPGTPTLRQSAAGMALTPAVVPEIPAYLIRRRE